VQDVPGGAEPLAQLAGDRRDAQQLTDGVLLELGQVGHGRRGYGCRRRGCGKRPAGERWSDERTGGGMKGALDVHRELLSRDVPHEMVRLSGRAGSADDLPRLPGAAGGCVAVRCYEVSRCAGDAFAAVLVPSGRLPQQGALLQALGARAVRPARPDVVNAVTDFASGLVSPVCLPEEVELLADTALGHSDVSYCAVGESEVVLGIRTRDLLVTTGARAASLTEPGARRTSPRCSTCRAGGARSAG
jgi:hypothetical protein